MTGGVTKGTQMTLGALGRFAIATAAVAALSACGTSASSAPTTSQAVTATSFPTVTAPNSDWMIRPGAIGAARAGMTQSQAVATGLFDANVQHIEPCRYLARLEWKGEPNGRDVITDDVGTITALGVFVNTISTREGIHVGSTLAELKAAYGNQLTLAKNDGQQYVELLLSGQDWMGFAFGTGLNEALKPTSKVGFIEVSQGARPSLDRDGC